MAANQTGREDQRKQFHAGKWILVLVNFILIVTAVGGSLFYSGKLQKEQRESEVGRFCSTIESMKQISVNYLTLELGYARDWSKYISGHDMTMEEALTYIKETNNQSDRYGHIVDMETFEAYSTHGNDGFSTVTCYEEFGREGNETDVIFMENMRQMFAGETELRVLSKYRADDTQLNVISVGTPVSIRQEDGSKREYLLLRVIPVESIRKIWVFPVEYMAAEVGIITQSGAYVVPSKSMKSRSFADFIRGYNFENDYNKVDELVRELTDNSEGLLVYRNAKGQECFWYYSGFSGDTGLDIVGSIPVEELNTHQTDWTIVAMICGVLAVIILIDGAYMLHMNRKLRETAEMAEEASRAKTQFLSTMSHDIRTPMNGIVGMVAIAKNHISDQHYVEACLDKVSLASDNLLMLINDILDISKIESGSMVLTPAVFSLERLTERLVNIVEMQLAGKEITFTVEKEIPQPYLVADEIRLNQIFLNLVNNAVKYTPAGGTIKLGMKERVLTAEKVKLVYCVADNGIGMTEEFQKNMYQMFARELDSRINKTQGTGLGLAIVKQMVDLMDGRITCDSEAGKGTVFTVTLYLDAAKPQEYRHLVRKNEADGQEDFYGDLKVLVAEDNDLNWEIISEILEEYGVHSDRAQNGQECVELLEGAGENGYDLVLMDIQMPVMNGKEAAGRIRESRNPSVKNITIVAMTADAFAEDIQACMDAGMDGHISKPIDIKKIEEVLRQVKQKREQKS